ncbi:hypothetical protein PAPYR_12402 [Paratrimastix pyriformis]|uniref:Uncharacterized protein n=1 Tax=Paratrimastix pyriformis TaxID=342808 RepID=A0ABQ8U8Q1_9EUKA|nr:hypothetical protein PAPYR_12402 [Paratrimastix pyriformis]
MSAHDLVDPSKRWVRMNFDRNHVGYVASGDRTDNVEEDWETMLSTLDPAAMNYVHFKVNDTESALLFLMSDRVSVSVKIRANATKETFRNLIHANFCYEMDDLGVSIDILRHRFPVMK